MPGKESLLYLLILIFITSACDDDTEITRLIFDTSTFEGSVETNPEIFPQGGGLDLNGDETGSTAQLDNEPNFLWDLKIVSFRSSAGDKTAVILAGDSSTNVAVAALNVSAEVDTIGYGLPGFDKFKSVNQELQDALHVDGVFNFDRLRDSDNAGNANLEKLEENFAKLVIGNNIDGVLESQQPVYLVRSLEGGLYKFQVIRIDGGGKVIIRWARFSGLAVE